TNKSCEHSRFGGAHELGPLVLHRHGAPPGPLAERGAHNFASAFLVPRASGRGRSPRFASAGPLISCKTFWTVSVAALAYRLHSLGIVSAWHYRSLYIEISKRGYRTQEPDGAPREISQLLAKVFSALREDGVSKDQIANDLKLPTQEIDQLVF